MGYLMFAASLPCFPVQAKGFVRPESCSIYNPLGGYALHLTSIGGHAPRKPVALVFASEQAWYVLLNTWNDTSGAYCRNVVCEPIAHAKYRIRHVSREMFISFRGRRISGVSGDFVVEFSNGTKLEGSFKAKTRKPVVHLICE